MCYNIGSLAPLFPSSIGGFKCCRLFVALLKEPGFAEDIQAMDDAIKDPHLKEVCLGYYIILVRIRDRTRFILNCVPHHVQ